MNEIDLLQQSVNISRYSLYSATAIAFFSIIIGIINLVFQRSHNVKSVKPHLEIISKFLNNQIELSIGNNGLGPMVIDNIEIKKSDDQFKSVSLSSIIPTTIEIENDNVDLINHMVKPSEKVTLIRLLPKYLDYGTKSNELTKILIQYKIRLRYHDLYNRKSKIEIDLNQKYKEEMADLWERS